MNNVIPMTQPKQGDQTFFLCGCNPKEPHPFIPIVLYQNPPVVVGLICPDCETQLTLVNGVVRMCCETGMKFDQDRFEVMRNERIRDSENPDDER